MSSQAAPSALQAVVGVNDRRLKSAAIARAVLVTIIVGLVYWNALAGLIRDWSTDVAESYGLMVVPFAAYMAWLRRRETLAIKPVPDSRGLVLLAAASIVFLCGRLGADFFLTRIAFVLTIAALIWITRGLGWLRSLGFPILLLLTAVPLPLTIYNAVAIHLQMIASVFATELAQAGGTVVYREGNILYLANASLGVAEACSGLRSLSSIVVLVLALGSMECARFRSRALLLVLAITLSIIVNTLRIAITAQLADHDAQFAMGFYHSITGWVMFLVEASCVVGLSKVLHKYLD